MIPLAQYLTEFDGEEQGAAEDAAPPSAGLNSKRGYQAEAFEPLRLVRSEGREPGTARARAASRSPFPCFDDEEAQEEAQEDATAAEDASLDAPPAPDIPADEGLDADLHGEGEEREPPAQSHEDALAATRETAEIEKNVAVEATRAEERERAERDKAAAVEAARAEWAAATGERLAADLDAAVTRLETQMKTRVERILRPLALDSRRRQSAAELAETAGKLFSAGEALNARVTGPADLVSAFQAACGARAEGVSIEIDESLSELTLTAAETTIETRLSEWTAALEEALA